MANRAHHQNGQQNPILGNDTFKMVADVQKQIADVTGEARDAVKKFYREPGDLAAFIERQGTPVYVLKRGCAGFFGSLALMALGYEPGFIPCQQTSQEGRRFNTLVRLLGLLEQKPYGSFDRGVFVVTSQLFTVGFLSHQLHHWLSCKSGMNGYNDEAQQLYKKFWVVHHGKVGREVYKMTANEITMLRAAINRDMEALKFVREVASEILVPAKQAERLQSGSASA